MSNHSAPIDAAILEELVAVVESRKSADPGDSYVASLLAEENPNRLLKKIGEEATETVLAAKDALHDGDKAAFIGEMADLWFHSLVLLAKLDLGPGDVLSELGQRFGRSGLEEKAARNR